MELKIKTPIEVELQSSIQPYLFKELLLPTIGENMEKLLAFSMMLDEWTPGIAIAKDDYVRFGVDGKGFPMVYQATGTHIAQINATPGSDNATNLYTLVGYVNGTRIWVKPYGTASSYQLDEQVPRLGNVEYAAKQYERGATVYKDEYIISPDNLVYQIVPNQIVMNTDAVQFTNTNVYRAIPEATVINETTISLLEYITWKSLRNNNMFEPIDDSLNWDRG